jgi:hypothetical protein
MAEVSSERALVEMAPNKVRRVQEGQVKSVAEMVVILQNEKVLGIQGLGEQG